MTNVCVSVNWVEVKLQLVVTSGCSRLQRLSDDVS